MRSWWIWLWVALTLPGLGQEQLVVAGTQRLALLDPVSLNVTRTIPLKGNPAGMHANRDRSRIYVISGGRELIEVVDLASGQVTRRLSFSQVEGLPRVRALVFALCTDPEERHLYVYLQPCVRERESIRLDPACVAVLDLATGRKIRSVPAPYGVTSMACTTDGRQALLFGRDLYQLDTRTYALTTREPVRHPRVQGEGETDVIAEWLHHREAGELASSAYFTEDPITGRWFIGLVTVDLASGTLDKLEAGPGPDALIPFSGLVSPDRRRGFLIFNQIIMLDLPERRVLADVRLPRSYAVMTISADGRRLYAAGSGASVLEFDTQAGRVLREVDLPFDTVEILMVPR